MALLSSSPVYQARDLAETAAHHSFPSLHAERLVFAALMVIATEVKDPMNQQSDDFFVQRPLAFFRLAHGGRHRNHDITQWPSGLTRHLRRTGLACGERQHVRAAVFAPEPEVETAHSPIADERETYIGRRLPHFAEHDLHQSRKALAVNRHGVDVGLKEDRHY
jgi:hypothetical protein